MVVRPRPAATWCRPTGPAVAASDTGPETRTLASGEPLTRDMLDQSLALGRQFLLTSQLPSGLFRYHVNFRTGEVLPEQSPVRQAGALWGVALIHQDQPAADTRAAVLRGLAYFSEHSQLTADGRRFIRFPGKRRWRQRCGGPGGPDADRFSAGRATGRTCALAKGGWASTCCFCRAWSVPTMASIANTCAARGKAGGRLRRTSMEKSCWPASKPPAICSATTCSPSFCGQRKLRMSRGPATPSRRIATTPTPKVIFSGPAWPWRSCTQRSGPRPSRMPSGRSGWRTG